MKPTPTIVIITMKSTVFVLLAACLWSNIKADYIAAVVEYGPMNGTSPNSTVEVNLREYLEFIETASNWRVQIIVFPEYGLTGLVDDPTNYAIEIPDDGTRFENYWLQSLSNAANEHGMYVVVNLLEKARNEKNDTIYYNTDVVFNNGGAIVAKYRKINLYYESKLTPGNSTVQFTTSFGITFGIFTCSDILFYVPSRKLLESPVTDFIFTAAWTSTLPFYHTLSIESGYALGNQVNLLAANLNSPSQGIGGSGIYAYDGTVLSYYISGLSSSKLLINTIQPRGTPKEPVNPFTTFSFDILGNGTAQSDIRNYATSRDFESSKYKFAGLNLATGDVAVTLCDRSFCCNFNISVAEVNTSDIYQLVAYHGKTKLGDTGDNTIRFCAILACETSDKSTCGSRNVNVTTKFREISIGGDFVYRHDYFYQPVTLTTNLLPVFNTTYRSERVNETHSVGIKTTRTADNVVVFGIYGRGAASTFGSSFICLVVFSIFRYLF